MNMPHFTRGRTQIVKYQPATSAAELAAVTPPKGMPYIQAAKSWCVTGIHYDFRGDQGTPVGAISSFDMAIETNELVDEGSWQPINVKLQPGEKLDFLGSSLTLGAEAMVLFRFGASPLPGVPRLQYTYHTFTAVATGVPTAMSSGLNMATNAKAVRIVQARGINLNTANIRFGGPGGGETGPFGGRHCSALNDIILPADWYTTDIPLQGGEVIEAVDGTDCGATGTSDLIIGYEYR